MEVPTSISGLFAAAGFLLLLAGLIGGGLDIRGVKIPKISVGSRIACVVGGAVVIGLGILFIFRPEGIGAVSHTPEPSRQTESLSSGVSDKDTLSSEPRPVRQPPEASAQDTMRMPDLTGFSLEDLRPRLASVGLRIGRVEEIDTWRPHRTVVSQNPEADAKVEKGTEVDVVIADSAVLYETDLQMETADGDSMRIRAVYKVRYLENRDGKVPVVEFIIVEATPRGLETQQEKLIRELFNKPGFLPLNELKTFEIDSGWEALSDQLLEMEHAMSQEQLSEKPELKAVGPMIFLAMISMEMKFQLNSVFSYLAAGQRFSDDQLTLQEKSGILSEFRLENPSMAGDTVTARLMRLPPNATRFERVGSAIYDREDGLLKKMQMTYRIGDEGLVKRIILRKPD